MYKSCLREEKKKNKFHIAFNRCVHIYKCQHDPVNVCIKN